jgi:TetR/AcrR family transcriptional regulator
MPKLIDHEQRKKEILYAALEVFAKEGYKDSNLGLIAAQCGLSRTTVYQYFKDKSDIFLYAIKATTDSMLEKYSAPEWTNIPDPAEKLLKIMLDILDTADSIEPQIRNLVKFLAEANYDISNIVKRRTALLSLYLSRTIRDIVKTSYTPDKKISAQEESKKLIALGESYCLQMIYLPENKKIVRELVTDQVMNLKK